MRVRWIACGILCALAGAARAELHFANPTVELGEVRGGNLLAQRFAFVNEGPEKVEITGLHASCGCLKPRLDPLVYQPGDKGELVMEVNPLTQSAGDHAWTVQVSYRLGGETREQSVRVTGKIVGEVQVQPAALTVFTDHELSHTLTVTDIRSKPLKITEATTTSRYLRARVGQPERDDKDHWTCRVTLEAGEDLPEGRHEEWLVLKTSDADYADLRIPVTLVKRPKERLTATPDLVTLIVPRDRPPPTRLIVLRDQEDRPVEIDRVDTDDPALTCHWSEGASTPAAVRVRIDAKGLREGPLHSAIHIHVKKPFATSISLPVRAEIP
jgi:hypothetical protein